MKIAYYPGCTLPQKASDFDISARTCCELLGIDLLEMEKWVCCGSAYNLDHENVMQQLAPIQNLIEARSVSDQVMTLCVFCYNSLKRANYLMQNEPEKRKIVTEYLDKKYDEQLEIYHLLEILRDKITFAKLKEKVKRPLTGMKIAPFYGCLLLRPQAEIGFDSPENPSVFEDLLTAMGAEVVSYPQRLECCGSYLSLKDGNHTKTCVDKIIDGAIKNGADAIVTSCPMCNFNFEFYGEKHQREGLHVFYFTELLAVALGAEPERSGLSQHQSDVKTFLEQFFCKEGEHLEKES